MIALIDHGIGNVRSVEKSLRLVGADIRLTRDFDEILSAEKVILPGVGAFGDCMDAVNGLGLAPVIHEVVARGTPLLGICVGMQMLFDHSQEMGHHTGLGILPGVVIRFELTDQPVPHTGWNQLWPQVATPLLRDIAPGSYAYFNHAYYCQPADPGLTLAATDYGIDFAAIVGRGRVYGIQGHPEKSQAVGLQFLRNFVEVG